MVDRLHIGQETTIRFVGFDSRTTPELQGRLSMVSPDATQDQRTGQSYYVVQARLLPGEVDRLNGAALRPGMPGEMHFITGDRSVFSYLIRPFSDQMARALRER